MLTFMNYSRRVDAWGTIVMSGTILGRIMLRAAGILPALALACVLASCSTIDVAPHLRPLPKETMMLLGKSGMDPQSPIFIRIFKEESELELWKPRDDGRFYHFKTYPICNWSGDIGPKMQQGDKQAPEGFYRSARRR